MNDNPETFPQLGAADADVSDAPERATVKPARKRRAAKPDEAGAALEAMDSMPDPTASAGAQEVDAAPPPKRRRTPKADAQALADGSADTAVADPAAPAVTAASASETSNEAQSQGAVAQGDGALPVGEEPAEATSGQGIPSSDDGPRGRRRGRRDRHRAERGESGEASDSDASRGAPAQAPIQAGELFANVLSGAFDVDGEPAVEAEEPGDEAAATKRVLQPEADAPKLHKVLAQSGIGSRRDMEVLIQDGHVSVNGEVAHVGQRVSFGDRVQVNGKPVRLRIVPPPPRIIAYHKPVGEIVTHDDPENRPTVFRRLPRLQQGKWQSVGRLDINTEGLLLFTTSGELANQLMHPRFGVEREYAVRVLGLLSEVDKESLLTGVNVDGQTASFRSIEDGGGDGANHWYRVVITEGRNREVRKLFDAVELTVSRLIRIRYGTVVLPLGLKRGVWVDLAEPDVRAIRRLASGDNGPREERGRGNQRAGGPAPRNQRQGSRQNDRADRADRGERARPQPNPRGRGSDGPPSSPSVGEDRGRGFDEDSDLDFDPASIPNPLEQTFDKRFTKNPRSPVGGRGFGRGGGGFGAGGSAPVPAKKVPGEANQPDPLQTSLGFIGGDAFHRKTRAGHSGGGGRGGNGGGARGGGFGGNRGGSGGGGRRGR